MQLDVHLTIDPATLAELQAKVLEFLAGLASQKAQLDRIEAGQAILNRKVGIILMDEQIVKDALTRIDAATNNTAKNVAAIATLDQQVSDELDSFIASAKNSGVSQALIDQVTSTAAKAQAASDAGDLIVPVLQAIAAKGVQNPVPVPVPPPVVVPA